MRVGLDVHLAVGTSTGIGEYASGLARALVALNECEVVGLSEPRLDPWRFDRRVIWDQVLLPLAAMRARVDLVHCTAGTMPLVATMPTVVTVHDVAWLRVQGHTRAYARLYFGRFALARYARARAISVDSEFSRDELLAVAPRLDPARVRVVYPGVDAAYGALQRRPDEAPFVLTPGTVEPRKNLLLAIEALAAVPSLRLISVGPATPYLALCEARAVELGVADRVRFEGYVARERLLDLHARATFVAVPSTYEGFGYAAAQALCAGIPVVATSASSVPEIVRDVWPTYDPRDISAWRDAFALVTSERDAFEQRAAAARAAACTRFAWESAARATLALYRSSLGSESPQ